METKEIALTIHHEINDSKAIEEEEEVHQANKNKQIAIKVHNLHKTYLLGLEGVPALRGINLDIYKGEFVIILGKSGGGKSSLLNIFGTIDQCTKGYIKIKSINKK